MKILLTLCAMIYAVHLFAAPYTAPAMGLSDMPEMSMMNELPAAATSLSIDDFLTLTPKKYRALTGEKLGFSNTLKLKAAQQIIKQKLKKGKHGEVYIEKALYIIMALFGLGWLAIGLMNDFRDSSWLICLLLYLLCFIPGLVYSLLNMRKYY